MEATEHNVKQLAAIRKAIAVVIADCESLYRESDDVEYVEIRLGYDINSDGSIGAWEVTHGDVCYDLIHYDDCASSEFDIGSDMGHSVWVSDSLVAQMLEGIAERNAA